MNEEYWKKIPNLEFYEVSNLGRIRSLFQGKILKFHQDKQGEMIVNLNIELNKRTLRRVKKLVAITFILNPKNLRYVECIDGNESNINITNLRWKDETIEGEMWKEIPLSIEFDKNRYYASDLGRIKSIFSYNIGRTEKINRISYIKGKADKNGYLEVCLHTKDGKRKYIRKHRLVALAFLPNPLNLPEVNHKNFITDNNNLDNLEWCTQEFNRKHAQEHGRFLGHPKAKGENAGLSKLKEKDVLFIREYAATHKVYGNRKKLMEIFDISTSTLRQIFTRETWKHI